MKFEDRFVEAMIQPKNVALKEKEISKTKLFDDRTVFSPNSLGRVYKLSQAYASVRNLEFPADKEISHQSFRDYFIRREHLINVRFHIEDKPRPTYPSDEKYLNKRRWYLHPRGKMLVLVDADIYNEVAALVDQYVLDVGRDGYWATIHVVNSGKPSDIRAFLKSKWCVGALLVGAIPVPWFEMDDDFHNSHSEFPCDLYYMDTNGSWKDPDGDGKFSGHSGDVNPELWIGRLYTPTANGNDAALINDYFARNHRFRQGRLGHAQSAMAYVDDDWQGFDDCEFDQMFPPSVITKYTNPNVTDGDLYRAEVNSLRSWVQLCAHSWPHGHALRVPAQNNSEYIQSDYFRDINPPNAHFYNLFCCGPGKFTTADYLAGWYIFDKQGGGTNNGLTAVASAKSGSMLMFADFYKPMGQGKSIGDAFVKWWKDRGPTHDLGERRWYYGLSLLGDPTLNWWKGAVPKLQEPQDGDVFNHYPRKLKFRWEAVQLPGARYTVEVDAFGAVNGGKWAAETGQRFARYYNITSNTLDHSFVGMQRGRWRVRARIDNRNCSWSPWSYFKFTI
ncbi:MAG: hypothetical protein GY850_39790 [bacterium]|nr:hypothetical protein [bacterium]